MSYELVITPNNKLEFRTLKPFLHKVQLSGVCLHPVLLCAGFPEGSGMGPSAAAELLEEATLPQGGERSPSDSSNAGEGHSISIQMIQQVKTTTTTENREVKG